MKCSMMLHFIWVFTVCKSTHLGVFSIQRVIFIKKIDRNHDYNVNDPIIMIELHCVLGGVLFAVNGPDYSDIEIQVQGFTIEIDTGKLRAQWNVPTKVFHSPNSF